MPKSIDGYTVDLAGSEDAVEVASLTEEQAKVCLCRMIDKLESVELSLTKFRKLFASWRAVEAPKARSTNTSVKSCQVSPTSTPGARYGV